eukprot:570479_1
MAATTPSKAGRHSLSAAWQPARMGGRDLVCITLVHFMEIKTFFQTPFSDRVVAGNNYISRQMAVIAQLSEMLSGHALEPLRGGGMLRSLDLARDGSGGARGGGGEGDEDTGDDDDDESGDDDGSGGAIRGRRGRLPRKGSLPSQGDESPGSSDSSSAGSSAASTPSGVGGGAGAAGALVPSGASLSPSATGSPVSSSSSSVPGSGEKRRRGADGEWKESASSSSASRRKPN